LTLSLREGWSVLRRNLALSTDHWVQARRTTDLPREELELYHESFLDEMARKRNELLTLGALGLAAWGVLESTTTLESFSLDILLVGVVIAMLGPLLFRAEGTECTRMGLETAATIAYSATVISLLSFVPAVFQHSWLNLVGFFVAAAVVVRDYAEVYREIPITRRILAYANRPSDT